MLLADPDDMGLGGNRKRLTGYGRPGLDVAPGPKGHFRWLFPSARADSSS
jgi:hypothetical protein